MEKIRVKKENQYNNQGQNYTFKVNYIFKIFLIKKSWNQVYLIL